MRDNALVLAYKRDSFVRETLITSVTEAIISASISNRNRHKVLCDAVTGQTAHRPTASALPQEVAVFRRRKAVIRMSKCGNGYGSETRVNILKKSESRRDLEPLPRHGG